jgi:hypothetical protein
MAETKPTNEQIVKMLENVLEELDQLRADLAKLAKTV